MSTGSTTETCPADWNLFCPSDAEFLKGLADEYAQIGTPVNVLPDGTVEKNPDGSTKPAVEYYQRDKSVSFDPVYREPTTDEIWRGPYRFPCTVEFEEADGHYNPEVETEGVERVYDAICSVTTNTWREHVVDAHDPAFKRPSEGDVVAFFNGAKTFSVEKVEAAGYVATSNVHALWKLSLKARDSFKPDRLLPPKLSTREEP